MNSKETLKPLTLSSPHQNHSSFPKNSSNEREENRSLEDPPGFLSNETFKKKMKIDEITTDKLPFAEFPKKFPFKKTNSKPSLQNKSSNLNKNEKFQRQYTLNTKRKSEFIMDKDNLSSDNSVKEEENISFIKKKPSKIDIYDALTEKVPKNQLKITRGYRNSTNMNIDTKAFCLTLKQNDPIEKQGQSPPLRQNSVHTLQKVRSNSIMGSVFKHLVGKLSENSDPKSNFRKQMSMKFPSTNTSNPNHDNENTNTKKHRPSIFGFMKNSKNQENSVDGGVINKNQETPISLKLVNKNQESPYQNETSSPTFKKDSEGKIKKNLKETSEKEGFSPGFESELSPDVVNSNTNIPEDKKMSDKDYRTLMTSTDFTLEDFVSLKTEIAREKKILEEEIKSVTMNKYTNVDMKLKGKFVEKWTRAKWNIKAAARMRRLNDDIKNFGSSFSVAGIKQKMDNLESLFIRQKTLTEKLGGAYVFLPESSVRIFWSYVVIFLLLYTSFITPYRVAFMDSSNVYDDWFFIETVIDVLFLIDILITLNSAFSDEKGKLVINRGAIFIEYLKSWLILDLLGIFPFYLLEEVMSSSLSFGNNYNDVLKFLRLPRLYRLIRIARLVKFMKKAKTLKFIEYIQDFFQMNAGSKKLFHFIFTISICVHIMGCMWYFAAKLQDFAPGTWVAMSGMEDNDNFSMYLTSIYWAFATLATVGYGDIHAYNDTEFLLSMIWMILGAGFYSFTLSSLSSLLANLDTRRAHLTNKLMLMDEFCKENKFSKALKKTVKTALEYSSFKTIFSSDDKNQLLNEIPTDLRFQIAEMMFKGLSNKIPFFKNKDKCFIANFVPLLNPLKVLHGELIFRKAEYPNLVYFLYNGRVNYVVGPQNIVFKSMVQGSYFGEIEIYENRSRYFSCRAEVQCDLLTISSDKFISLMKSFPDHEAEIKSIIAERKKRNEIALEKIMNIAPISINSEFWKKKKEVNLYEAVKRKRLHLNPIQFDQSTREEIVDPAGVSKMIRIKRFFTNIFSINKNRQSLTKEENERFFMNKTPITKGKTFSQIQPEEKSKNNKLNKGLSIDTRNSLVRKGYKGSKEENQDSLQEKNEKLFTLNSNKPLISQIIESAPAKEQNLKINSNKEEDKFNISSNKEEKTYRNSIIIENINTNKDEKIYGNSYDKNENLNINSNKKEEFLNINSNMLNESNPQDHMTASSKKKKVTIKPPDENDYENNKLEINNKHTILASLRSSFRNQEPHSEKKNSLLNEIQEDDDEMMKNTDKIEFLSKEFTFSETNQNQKTPLIKNQRLSLKKEDEEIDRKRSKTDHKRPAAVKREGFRKFSAFKNKEIKKILESFSQSPQLRPQPRKSNDKKLEEKVNFLKINLLVFQKNVLKHAINADFNEKSVNNIQLQLNNANEYLKLAVKRNKMIKNDPNFKGYYLKKNTFNVGEKLFTTAGIKKPDVSVHKRNLHFLTEMLDSYEILDFPEPEKFFL